MFPFKPFAALVATGLAMTALPTGPAVAQHMDHTAHMSGTGSALPVEPGQGAFAALSEIVAMLSADPDTDWSRVDIDALRAHLVDMNRLVMDTYVRSEPVDGGLRMWIATDGPGGEAATRMVPAHGAILAAETGWVSDMGSDGTDIVWTVTGGAGDDVRIRALGFYGLMATGDHHRMHHMGLARGMPVH
ncbi:hypothetical protein [Chachezhania sediminis]|uniref:hypothetical protein n=1 Tax=Chachezhania sediminis TaxID=2599291 RepID=UPI001E4C70F8|nr:hypothetical protein [Chachezhania sediminis]